MFRSIRVRLMAILALPVVLLIVVAAAAFSGAASDEERAENVEAFVANDVTFTAAVEALQQERAVSTGWTEPEAGVDPSAVTDAAVESAIATNPDLAPLTDLVAEARLSEGGAAWSAAIERVLDLPLGDATASNASIDRNIRATRQLAQIEELYFGLGALLEAGDAEGVAAQQLRIDVVVDEFRTASANSGRFAIDSMLATEWNRDLAIGEERLIADGTAPSADAINAAVGLAGEIDIMRADALDAAAETAAADVLDAGNRRALYALLGILGGLTVLGLTYVAHKSVMDPLQTLTVEANRTANTTLPVLVEDLERLGAEDVDIDLNPISSADDSEIGQVVDAFNSVHDTAVDLAIRQTRARRSVGEFFVTVGRRNQRLLERQMRQIAELEQYTQDREIMAKLFEIDHVAARMRRNSESLLVLAGADSPRQWRNPVPVETVAKAVLAEVDDYDRVDVASMPDARVLGTAAADVTHLLAELVENALTFSDPTTTVVVDGVMTTEGMTVTVTDLGVGVEKDQLDEINTTFRLRHHLDQATGRQLGTLLASGLAQRHGITVEAIQNLPNGLAVRVALPGSLLAGGPAVTDTVEAPVEPAPEMDTAAPAIDAVAAPAAIEAPAPADAPAPAAPEVAAPAAALDATALPTRTRTPAAAPEPVADTPTADAPVAASPFTEPAATESPFADAPTPAAPAAPSALDFFAEPPAPPTPDPAPAAEVPAPFTDAEAPVADAAAPVVEATTPVIEPPAPIVEAPAPAIEPPAPVVEATVPEPAAESNDVFAFFGGETPAPGDGESDATATGSIAADTIATDTIDALEPVEAEPAFAEMEPTFTEAPTERPVAERVDLFANDEPRPATAVAQPASIIQPPAADSDAAPPGNDLFALFDGPPADTAVPEASTWGPRDDAPTEPAPTAAGWGQRADTGTADNASREAAMRMGLDPRGMRAKIAEIREEEPIDNPGQEGDFR